MSLGPSAPPTSALERSGLKLVGWRGRPFLYSRRTDRIHPLGSRTASLLSRAGIDPEVVARLESAGAPAPSPPRRPSPEALREEIRGALSDAIQQIVLGVTEACNLRCRYCVYSGNYTGMRTHSASRMPWDVARKAIDYLFEHSGASGVPPGIAFYGGEPLLELDLLERCVRHARSRVGADGVRFVITTNGVLLGERARRLMVDNDFTLIVSLDGPAEIHDRYRRDAGDHATFRRIRRNVEALREEAPDYHDSRLRFSVVLAPPVDYEALIAFFDDTGMPCVVSPMEAFGLADRDPGDGRDPGFPVIAGAFEEACRSRDASSGNGADLWRRFVVGILGPALRRIQTRGERPAAGWYRLGQCIPGNRKIFVDHEGSLYPCEKVEGGPDVRIGHVDDGIDPQRVEALLERFMDLVERHCGDCWMRRMCSACLADVAQGGRFDEAKLEVRCRARLRAQANTLGLYAALLEEDRHALDFLPRAFPWG